MFLITPEMKDIVLADLLSADKPRFKFDYDNSQEEYGFAPSYTKMLLDQFQNLGLLKITYSYSDGAVIEISTKAMDLYRHGGFKAEEELLKSNIEKLSLELQNLSKQLEPKYAEKASQLAQIAGTLMQGLTLFMK
ncbi:hypothetical protein HMPREF9136_2632 [Prevotella dentalis DSM 3688]|uniref:Uncharacterized protein n=2 Tax=Prevotella dentalis (strain ATCC 49559 / DSM 3688 / JCM 13448 / NCTC 12043 / ES 2772) TaxID=908937 RepID=F9D704_PREDD|nr:hypothetical protein HMPREF9136_2632 [Prevotella dentalis DSM 3688]